MPDPARLVYRHPLPIRLAHWLNVVAMTILLMSGLQIFNAHPALDLGATSNFQHPPVSIGATGETPDRGFVEAFGRRFATTGLLGVSALDGQPTERAFPGWITLPREQDLATGRRWHFLFAWIFVANGLVYLGYGLASGQLRARLIPRAGELATSLRAHLRLHIPRGEARYNGLQKLTYLIVVLALLPLQILAGLAMSPGFDAFAPWLPEAFGGRQSARTVHFVIAGLLALFVVVHLAMVLLTGPFNQLRGMVTGWFAVRAEEER